MVPIKHQNHWQALLKGRYLFAGSDGGIAKKTLQDGITYHRTRYIIIGTCKTKKQGEENNIKEEEKHGRKNKGRDYRVKAN